MTTAEPISDLDAIIAHARAAQMPYEAGDSQARHGLAAEAVGWAILEPARSRALAELAAETTGLENMPGKITKITARHWVCCGT